MPLHDTPLNRRRMLRLLGAATALGVAAPAFPVTAAAAEDVYGLLRARWVELLTGSGFDPGREPYASMLASLGRDARSLRLSMVLNGPGLWPDLPIGTASGNLTGMTRRLRTMALAYVQPGTGSTGDPELAQSVVSGLDWVRANAYTATAAQYGNWWDWHIGTPQALLDCYALIYPTLTETQVQSYCTAVDIQVPDSRVATYSGTSTGANRADLCQVIALRGMIGRNSTKLTLAKTALVPVFPFVRLGDGFYADGSYIQHGVTPYAGSYGEVFVGVLSKLLALTAGTQWAVTDPQVQNFYDSVAASYAPFMLNGLITDAVSGRMISRGLGANSSTQRDEHTRGHAVLGHILRLATVGGATAAESATWKRMVKGWLERDTSPYLRDTGVGIPEYARAEALLADTSVIGSTEPVLTRVYAMDRAAHRLAAWTAFISFCSARTTFYTSGNGENLKGWHTNSGFLQWYGADFGNDQYSDAFWPTVDPYMLPGTTVSTKPLADAAGGPWGATRPDATWAGGASDGTYTAVGQDVRGLQSTLTGRKSWFCLDDAIMCLGAGIRATDGVPVQTTVDNRNLGAAGTAAFRVDGVVRTGTGDWSRRFTAAKSMTIDGMGSWVFPGGATVNAKRQTRTGAWSDINTSSSTKPLTRTYLSMWFDHGIDPTDAGYSYLLMPGADAATAVARAANPGFGILANTRTVQAVKLEEPNLLMANFFAAGTVGPVTVSGPCSVLVRKVEHNLTITVADPTRAATTVRVTVAKHGYATPERVAGVNVLTTNGKVDLLFEVGGTMGASLSITLADTDNSDRTVRTPMAVRAHETTFIRDGASADTNFSALPQLTVKNANGSAGFNRRALMKFDLAEVVGTVTKAVLWTAGKVQDAGGIKATVQAFGLAHDNWAESTVTWNTAPALGPALGTGTIQLTPDWVGIDVTAAVAAAAPGVGGDAVASVAVFEPLGAAGLLVNLETRSSAAFAPVLQIITDTTTANKSQGRSPHAARAS